MEFTISYFGAEVDPVYTNRLKFLSSLNQNHSTDFDPKFPFTRLTNEWTILPLDTTGKFAIARTIIFEDNVELDTPKYSSSTWEHLRELLNLDKPKWHCNIKLKLT